MCVCVCVCVCVRVCMCMFVCVSVRVRVRVHVRVRGRHDAQFRAIYLSQACYAMGITRAACCSEARLIYPLTHHTPICPPTQRPPASIIQPVHPSVTGL